MEQKKREGKLTGSDGIPEGDVSGQDLRIFLKGDVAAHHVVEQNAQRPDGGAVAVIASRADPFGRAVNSSACWKSQQHFPLSITFFTIYSDKNNRSFDR
jgi:hypothetical protein